MQSSTGQTSDAQIAADAFGFVDDELPLAVDAGEDRLVRRVLADDVAAAALDAEILIDLGLGHVIEIEILPVGDRGNRAAAEVLDRRGSPSRPCSSRGR